jgi:cytochrome bd-type quinol oxidase subunit 2
VGKDYKYIFRDIYLTLNYSIKGLRIIFLLLLVLTSLRHGIQINKRKQDTKELAKNLLNFFLVIVASWIRRCVLRPLKN